MSGVLMLNSSKVAADTSPVAPAALPSPYVDQSPNPFEAMGTLSDVGGLGFLFNHDPVEWVPAPLEATQTSPASDVNVSNEALMAIGNDQVDTIIPQNDPHQAQVVTPQNSSGWRFRDTLKKEVATFQGRVQDIFSSANANSFND